jgi:16S rRNA G966 N2-methylase RsmD
VARGGTVGATKNLLLTNHSEDSLMQTAIPTRAFDEPLSQDALDIEDKTRSNPFAWRGQFSPQLVESLISEYGTRGERVLDPFVGSGSVLHEAGCLGSPAIGGEINPAAVLLAKTYEFINVPAEKRQQRVNNIEALLSHHFPRSLPLFDENAAHVNEENETSVDSVLDRLLSLATEAGSERGRRLTETLILLLKAGKKEISLEAVWERWHQLKDLVLDLPLSDAPIRVDLFDARDLPLQSGSTDFVLTSPPYINVFNYHQNYRKSVEALGWDVLQAARSEIGANRKFRRNRFLTVAQYCMDMALCFAELSRVCRQDARIMLVVGRESTVLGTPFYNADILSAVAEECGLLSAVLQQERVFKNKFGRDIWEHILHFRPVKSERGPKGIVKRAREIGAHVLKDALQRVPKKSEEALRAAVEEAREVAPSQFFDVQNQSVSLNSPEEPSPTA